MGEAVKIIEKKVFQETIPKLVSKDEEILEEVEKQRIDSKVKIELQVSNVKRIQTEVDKLQDSIKQVREEAEKKKNESILYS